ncbi:ECF subfamily RNA polymerase, sigma-24 subunit [Melioribacter roseus P3M-2]|uniref:RNA polymerase sigma factor n=1 Tax=Melioribacter roseus (strain DSM 23840 / JCM 17771 / VKM B-2668 / P3M-2) TaxID=1191523 RepID=I7A5P2_MELRP|nr:RNA polymerase sigma factor [Melioribacter roseus]AFN75221.1 ECF subfamily RNA polymerase, sigma-24 subunit [Melioribacter roseus P3M-2]
MNKDNDFELVNRFKAGDETAFNEIVRKYQKRIYWHARQMLGNHLDADEVTQQVLIVIYEKLHTFNFQSSLFTWIYRIATTRSLNLLKRKNIKRFFSIDDEDTDFDLKSETDIIKDLDNKQKLEKLEKMLNKLPPKQKQVFIMRNFDEFSYEEISQITGKSVGGLKATYFHAIKKITEWMNYEIE